MKKYMICEKKNYWNTGSCSFGTSIFKVQQRSWCTLCIWIDVRPYFLTYKSAKEWVESRQDLERKWKIRWHCVGEY